MVKSINFNAEVSTFIDTKLGKNKFKFHHSETNSKKQNSNPNCFVYENKKFGETITIKLYSNGDIKSISYDNGWYSIGGKIGDMDILNIALTEIINTSKEHRNSK